MPTEALTIREQLEEKKPDIRQLLPSHVDVDRFIKSALLAVARNSDLKKCTVASVFTAIVNAAELGLDFTPAKGHAYLVPFNNHGTLEAEFMPGYRGFIYLAKNAGVVTKIEAHLVYEKDQFELFYGTEPKLYHKPCLEESPGKVIGAYAVAFFSNTSPQSDYMRLDELKAIRTRSKAKKGPWATDEGEMMRKTPVRRLFKYLPSSPDIDKALEADNQAVGLIDFDISDQPLEDGERTSQLSDKLDGVSDNNKTEQGEPLEMTAQDA